MKTLNKITIGFLVLIVLFLAFRGWQNRNYEHPRKEPSVSERNKKYFSGWDGSNPELVDYVKERMNDPGSFEHVETRFHEYDGGDKLRLIMKYRGRNGFGGIVTESMGADFYKPTRTLSNVNGH